MKVDRDKLHQIAKRLDALYDEVLALLREPDELPPMPCCGTIDFGAAVTRVISDPDAAERIIKAAGESFEDRLKVIREIADKKP
jgi:hypothetical protein